MEKNPNSFSGGGLGPHIRGASQKTQGCCTPAREGKRRKASQPESIEYLGPDSARKRRGREKKKGRKPSTSALRKREREKGEKERALYSSAI